MPPGWDATRRRVLARDHWLCRLSFVGCTVHATEVHHSVRGVEVEATLLAACSWCHGIVTAQQATAARWPAADPGPPRAAPAGRAAATRGREGPPPRASATSGSLSPRIRGQVSAKTRDDG
jgi:hypothetical protein